MILARMFSANICLAAYSKFNIERHTSHKNTKFSLYSFIPACPRGPRIPHHLHRSTLQEKHNACHDINKSGENNSRPNNQFLPSSPLPNDSKDKCANRCLHRSIREIDRYSKDEVDLECFNNLFISQIIDMAISTDR